MLKKKVFPVMARSLRMVISDRDATRFARGRGLHREDRISAAQACENVLHRSAGSCIPRFEEAMRAEHCTLGGSEVRFSTLNYTKIESWPKREWEIVMHEASCTKDEMRFNRRVPIISDLLQLPLAKEARLSKAEIIAIVLYTGPMVRSHTKMGVIGRSAPSSHGECALMCVCRILKLCV